MTQCPTCHQPLPLAAAFPRDLPPVVQLAPPWTPYEADRPPASPEELAHTSRTLEAYEAGRPGGHWQAHLFNQKTGEVL